MSSDQVVTQVVGGLREELRLLSGFQYKEVLMRFGATNWICSTGRGAEFSFRHKSGMSIRFPAYKLWVAGI